MALWEAASRRHSTPAEATYRNLLSIYSGTDWDRPPHRGIGLSFGSAAAILAAFVERRRPHCRLGDLETEAVLAVSVSFLARMLTSDQPEGWGTWAGFPWIRQALDRLA